MRDILLSGTAGFLLSCAGAFTVHRSLWKAADEHAKQLDTMVGNDSASSTSSAAARRQVRPSSKQIFPVSRSTFADPASHLPVVLQTESFEAFIVRRASQWWNAGVDNIHARLGRLPSTVENIVDDVKSGKDTPQQRA